MSPPPARFADIQNSSPDRGARRGAGGLNVRRTDMARRGAVALALLAGLIAVEAALLAAAAGFAPNAVTVPLAEQSALLATLWKSNPAAALPLTAQQALVVIARNDPEVSLQTWGLYLFPFTLFVHALVALVAVRWWRAGRRHPVVFVAGSAALLFAVSYTRLASCCTGGPRWAFEIILLAFAFDPTITRIDWSAVIVRLERFFPYLQLATGLTGIALLILAMYRWRVR